MNPDVLKEAILNVKNSKKDAKNIPFSIVVVSDKHWLDEGSDKFQLFVLLVLLLKDNIQMINRFLCRSI